MKIFDFLQEKRNIILRFLFLSIAGTLLHFTYGWSGNNPIVGIFSATNESTWEHLKLLFFPMFFLTIWDLLKDKASPMELLFPRTIGICSGMIFIVVAFYITWGVTGKLIGYVNIALFFFGIIFALWMEHIIHNIMRPDVLSLCMAVLILLLITLSFIVFTFKTPGAGIFYNLIYHPKG